MAYGFRCSAYSVPAAYVGRILTNVERFEPVEWTVSAQVGNPRA
jgi:hypothetical protein